MGRSKFLWHGYFYRIVFNLGESPWLVTNSTVMFFPGRIPPDEYIRKEAERKLSEIYDAKVVICQFYPIEAKTTFLV